MPIRRKIVGWEIADNMRHENAMTALKMAFRQCRRGQHPIHHSDKGLQYCAKPYVEMLRRRHARISMTEGHDPRNNGIAERVNGILKEEFLKHMDVRKDNIRQVLEDVINTYHTRRPHLSLGMLTPDEVHRGAAVPDVSSGKILPEICMSQDFSVLLHTPTDGTDGDCTASLKIPGASMFSEDFTPTSGDLRLIPACLHSLRTV